MLAFWLLRCSTLKKYDAAFESEPLSVPLYMML
jgi:hypothetical protein